MYRKVHYNTSNSKGKLDLPICFNQNFLVFLIILYETKIESKTIIVIRYFILPFGSLSIGPW